MTGCRCTWLPPARIFSFIFLLFINISCNAMFLKGAFLYPFAAHGFAFNYPFLKKVYLEAGKPRSLAVLFQDIQPDRQLPRGCCCSGHARAVLRRKLAELTNHQLGRIANAVWPGKQKELPSPDSVREELEGNCLIPAQLHRFVFIVKMA